MGVLFLPSSDAYVRSFLYLLYTLIKLYYTKGLSDPALSLAPDWIRLLQRPRIPASYRLVTTFHRQHIKKQRHYFANKGLCSQSYDFSSSHVWMWELEYKESWVPQNWCFWAEVFKQTFESPLDCKEIQPVHPKEDQSWMFIGRTDVEAETQILWPPDVKSWLIWKDPDAGKDWRWEEKGMTEDEMVGWHHGLNGHEFE